MRVLGISAFYHDSAAALIADGRIVAAAQEERFTRKKFDADYPRHAIEYCLNAGGVTLADVDYVAFYDKPFLKFERLLETYLTFSPRGFRSFRMALPLWLREKLFLKSLLASELKALEPKFDWDKRLAFSEHHLSHAASAFYPSPFQRAAVLTMDGVGEWATTSAGVGNGHELKIQKEINFPHSLGLLYAAFTYYTGFKVNSGEYKVMGLAPYGIPKYAQLIYDNLIDLKPDGSFRLNLDYFNYCTGLTMTNERFDALFDGAPRMPAAPLEQRHMDLAASIQTVTEEIMLRLTRSIADETGAENLCLAGGVALNCVANGRIVREAGFDNVWIQPAAGDDGIAIGCAYYGYLALLKKPRSSVMTHAFLGAPYSDEDARAATDTWLVRLQTINTPSKNICRDTARLLSEGHVFAWFQGRSEFGPRALGNRSILADPRKAEMKDKLNKRVKHRQAFRPFAPVVLAERANEIFEGNEESPFMLLVKRVRPQWRDKIPAIVHVDGTARVQTVRQDQNERLYGLLKEFDAITGVPVLLNTSLNVKGEPIVETPADALACFLGTGIDYLALHDMLIAKNRFYRIVWPLRSAYAEMSSVVQRGLTVEVRD